MDSAARWPSIRARVLALGSDDLPVALIFIAVAALACQTPPQSDTFFHLRAGQSIWQSGAIPLTETFSHTFQGREWLNHEWLSQLFFYGVYMLGGPFLLTLVCGACACAAVTASWTLMRGSFDIRLVLLLSLLILTPSEWAVRPQALSLAMLMLTAWLVMRDRIAWLPLLFAAWANGHGVVLLGVVLAGVNALDALIWNRRRAPRAVAVAMLCVLAPMLTPLGWQYWPRVAQTVHEARLLGIHEYRSAFADLSSLPFWAMLAVLVGLTIARARTVATLARSDRVLVLASGIIGVAAILSMRNVPSFALLAAPALSRLVPAAPLRRPRPLHSGGYALLASGLAIAVAVVAFSWRNGGAAMGWRPLSAPAVSAIEHCPGPMYNEYGEGGTLMWFVPDRAVFVDGRVEAYPLDFLRRVRGADLSGRYNDLFEQFKVRCAVTRTGSPLTAALRGDSGATLRFSDANWSVFDTLSHASRIAGSEENPTAPAGTLGQSRPSFGR